MRIDTEEDERILQELEDDLINSEGEDDVHNYDEVADSGRIDKTTGEFLPRGYY